MLSITQMVIKDYCSSTSRAVTKFVSNNIQSHPKPRENTLFPTLVWPGPRLANIEVEHIEPQ